MHKNKNKKTCVRAMQSVQKFFVLFIKYADMCDSCRCVFTFGKRLECTTFGIKIKTF